MNGTRTLSVVTALLALAVPLPVFAQQPQQTVDPRIAPQAMMAAQAMIQLRDAEIRAMQEDHAKLTADWGAAFKAWCGDRPACGLAPAPVAQNDSPTPATQPTEGKAK